MTAREDDPPTHPQDSAPDAAAAEDLWLVSLAENEDRELSTAEVVAKLMNREIKPAMLIWREGMLEWKPISTIPEFKKTVADLIKQITLTKGKPNAAPRPGPSVPKPATAKAATPKPPRAVPRAEGRGTFDAATAPHAATGNPNPERKNEPIKIPARQPTRGATQLGLPSPSRALSPEAKNSAGATAASNTECEGPPANSAAPPSPPAIGAEGPTAPIFPPRIHVGEARAVADDDGWDDETHVIEPSTARPVALMKRMTTEDSDAETPAPAPLEPRLDPNSDTPTPGLASALLATPIETPEGALLKLSERQDDASTPAPAASFDPDDPMDDASVTASLVARWDTAEAPAPAPEPPLPIGSKGVSPNRDDAEPISLAPAEVQSERPSARYSEFDVDESEDEVTSIALRNRARPVPEEATTPVLPSQEPSLPVPFFPPAPLLHSPLAGTSKQQGDGEDEITVAEGFRAPRPLPKPTPVALPVSPPAAPVPELENIDEWQHGRQPKLGFLLGAAALVVGFFILQQRSADEVTSPEVGRRAESQPASFPAPASAKPDPVEEPAPKAEAAQPEVVEPAPSPPVPVAASTREDHTPATGPAQPASEPAIQRVAAQQPAPEIKTRPAPPEAPAPAPSLRQAESEPAPAPTPVAATAAEADPQVSPPPPKPAVAANSDAPFDKAAAAAALEEAARQASSCRGEGDPSGVAQVSVTFSSSGRATLALVQGPPFAGTKTGGCIAATLRKAQVPPFAGDRVTVMKRVIIN